RCGLIRRVELVIVIFVRHNPYDGMTWVRDAKKSSVELYATGGVSGEGNHTSKRAPSFMF
ncbi:MAG: hypothetical protein ACI9KE_000998, partial [Polyangiales bacterium]